MTDLLGLIERDGVKLRLAASTDGGEYHGGPCPFCREGHDRFHAWPHADRPRWWCRKCDLKGDAIQYLVERGFTYRAACAQLGIAADSARPFGRAATDSRHRPGNRAPVASAPRREPTSIPTEPPSAVWQAQAAEFVERSHRYLCSAGGANMRAYLRGRGLTDDTVERAQLGFSQADAFEDPTAWGLEPWVNRAGRPGRVWLPRGLVIPSRAHGALWCVAVRRPLKGEALDRAIGGGADGGGKYLRLRGHKPALFGADDLRPCCAAVWPEGELDALLLRQEAGDLATAVSMGGASLKPTGRWLVDLAAARLILRLADGDAAGIAAAERDAGLSPRIHVARLPGGFKDATAYHQAGGSLRAFVAHHLERLSRDPAADELADAWAAYRHAQDEWAALLVRETAALEAGDETEAARLKRAAADFDRGTVAPARERCWALEDRQRRPAA